MNAQNLDLTATTILKSLYLALYLNSKGRIKKNIADDEKSIHCMLLSFHTWIVLFFLSVKILQIIIQAEHTLRNINITTEIGK